MPEINPDDVLDEEELEEYDNKYNIATSGLSMEHAITSIIQMSIHIMIRYQL